MSLILRSNHVHSSLGISQILFTLAAGNMNIDTDQSFIRAWEFDSYLIESIRVYNASISLTTAAGGIYIAAAKAGNAIVAAAQAYAALDAATKGLDLTLTAFAKDLLTATPILSLTTPQGGASTAAFQIIGIPIAVAA
jgi:hypothetical protein